MENNINIYFADFGLALDMNLNNPQFSKCGTPGYVAPEIINCDSNKEL